MSEILTTNIDPVRATSRESDRWKNSIKTAIRSAAELLEELGLEDIAGVSSEATHAFPVFVTREFLARMQYGDPNDPLLRQVLPLDQEMQPVDGYTADPLQESEATASSGLLQKYAGRALLVTTGACAIHCRYCFRRHFPYASVPHSIDAWTPALDRVAADESIDEILLSGGDPLMLVDELLEQLVEAIQRIPHVRRLRVHSRLPIVLPSRVTDNLIRMLTDTRLSTWMVVHANHPREIDCSVTEAFAKMIDHGIPVLNQAVLLRGVNDDARTLEELCRRLVNDRVTPYYLHRLDHVSGAAHFAVDEHIGRRLISELRSRLPGYAVPQFVVEEPASNSKTVIQ